MSKQLYIFGNSPFFFQIRNLSLELAKQCALIFLISEAGRAYKRDAYKIFFLEGWTGILFAVQDVQAVADQERESNL